MIVTGWRVALEVALGILMLILAFASWTWFQTGVFNLLFGTAPLLEQIVFCAMMFGGIFVIFWFGAWQRIELRPDTQTLRVASINTLYRWRTLHASDIAKIGYYSHSKSLGQLLLSGSSGTRALAILEDSMFVTGPSRFMKKIAGFIRTHNPNAEIAAALTDSSA